MKINRPSRTPLQQALFHLSRLASYYQVVPLDERGFARIVDAYEEVKRLRMQQLEQEERIQSEAHGQAERVRIEQEALRKCIEKGTLI